MPRRATSALRRPSIGNRLLRDLTRSGLVLGMALGLPGSAGYAAVQQGSGDPVFPPVALRECVDGAGADSIAPATPLAPASVDPSVPDPSGSEESGLRLVLNIPGFRLVAYENGLETRSYTISPGSARYPTPIGSFDITYVIWNPWWIPPATDWARGEAPVAPGSRNPMGWVKLNFRPLYFLHGTPDEASLGRAASHGCVRMANRDAIELARLVHSYASPELTDADLDRLEHNPMRSERVTLQRPVPLSIVYIDVEVRDDELRIHPDVYQRFRGGLEDRILETLVRAGYSSADVAASMLSELVERSSHGPLSIPIDSVLSATATGATVEIGSRLARQSPRP